MMKPISEPQRAAIRVMLDALGDRRCMPTCRELSASLGAYGPATGHRLISGLRARGLVTGGARPTFSAACFKGFKFDPENGLQRVF